MEYASKGIANAGLATGIIGTTLGALDAMGGVAGLLGGRQQVSDGDRPVTRYEMGLIQESMSKDNEITLLKSQKYTDQVAMGIQGQISAQNAWNSAQMVNIQNIKKQLGQVVKPFVPPYAIATYPYYPPVPEVTPATTTGSGS